MHDLLCAIERLIDSKMSKTDKEFYDVSEACQFLGLSKSTIYKMTSAKVLPVYKPNNKKVYFSRVDLCNYVAKNRFMSQEEIIEKSNLHFQNKRGGNYVR